MTAQDASASFSSTDLGKKVARGTASLLIREAVLKIVALGAGIVLARALAPRDYGIFAILGLFNSFLFAFGAYGLSAAIVQRQQEPGSEELAALFSFQVAIAAAMVVVLSFSAPWLSATYHLGVVGVWLIRAMALSFLLNAAAATPRAILERNLAFGQVALIEVGSGITYQIVVVWLALAGRGVWSLVLATLVSSAVTMLLAFIASAWHPRFSKNWRGIKPSISYGLKYQVNTITAVLKDSVSPIFVAAVFGASAVGYISWATTVAAYPLVLVNITNRVMFPAFSRVARDKVLLQNAIEVAFRCVAYTLFPFIAILSGLAPYMVHIIYTDKWQPAVRILYMLLIGTGMFGFVGILIAGLYAIGKPGVIARFMVVWLIFNWALSIPLVLWFGPFGYAIANACIALSQAVLYIEVRKYLEISVLRNLLAPFLALAICLFSAHFMALFHAPHNIILLAGEVLLSLIVFFGVEWLVDNNFRKDLFLLKSVFAR